MKHFSLVCKACLTTAALVAGHAVHAQTTGGTVNFTGSLTSSTCAFRMGGATTNSLAVTLPAVQASSISTIGTASQDSASFTLGFGGCGTSPSPATAYFYFSSSAAANNLISNKSTTGGATNVALQLQDSTGTAIPVTTTATKYATGVTLDTANGNKDATFKVKYYSTAASPVAGAVTGDLIVNWSYQ